MSNREERERLRQQRLAAEASRGSSDRRRLVVGYVVAGVLAAAVLAGLVAVIASGGSDDGGGAAATRPRTPTSGSDFGVIEGYEPDTREGTPPPELQFGDLEESAQKAGCEAKLDLPDEGANHFDGREQGHLQDQPADLRRPLRGADRDRLRPGRRRRLPDHPARIATGALDGARPGRDPLLARAPGGPAARAEGRLRRGPGRNRHVPRPRPALSRSRSAPGPTTSAASSTTRSCSTWSGTSATPSAATGPRTSRSPKPPQPFCFTLCALGVGAAAAAGRRDLDLRLRLAAVVERALAAASSRFFESSSFSFAVSPI